MADKDVRSGFECRVCKVDNKLCGNFARAGRSLVRMDGNDNVIGHPASIANRLSQAFEVTRIGLGDNGWAFGPLECLVEKMHALGRVRLSPREWI